MNADTGGIQDALHPQFGAGLSGRIVMMPTSRGSCSGSGVLLNLALIGNAPAVFVFREDEEVLTLGAVVAARMFGKRIGVIRLDAVEYDRLAGAARAVVFEDKIDAIALARQFHPDIMRLQIDAQMDLTPEVFQKAVSGEAAFYRHMSV